MKIILAGSPQISIKAFEQVIKNFDVIAIISQPDKQKGRGMELRETSVSALAKEHNIKLFKPKKIGEIYEELKNLDFDIILTFAYGQYIPTNILKLGNFLPINIHGSLLPKYRGAAPIHHAILNGEKEIGITLIEMTKEMDAGDMFFKAKQKIEESTNTGEAFEIISKLASKNIVSWLNIIFNGDIMKQKQGDDFTFSPKIDKEHGEINMNTNLIDAKRKIRGLTPFPGAYTYLEGKRYKLFDFKDKYKNGYLKIITKNGELYINDYQKEGKKRNQLT